MTIDNRAISVSLVVLATIAIFYVLVVGQAFLVPLAVAVMVWYVINALSRTSRARFHFLRSPIGSL